MDPRTTEELSRVLNSIRKTDELRAYVSDPAAMSAFHSFSEYFNSLPAVRNMDRAELIRKSGIERTYCYQILNGRRQPGRDKVLALCIAAGLDLNSTQKALEAAGEPTLYARNRRDAICIFIFNKKLGVNDAQDLLAQFGEPPLS